MTDFLKVGVSRVFVMFVLCLGELFQVSKGMGPADFAEPWHRYLSDFELSSLRKAEGEVFNLLSGAVVGEVPLGLRERERELRDLKRTLHRVATRRLFEEVRGSYDDPTRLWSFVRKFRVKQDQGVLPVDILVQHFSAVFNRQSDPVPMVFCECNFAASDDWLDEFFSHSELEAAFKALDRGTAPGVTGIGNDILRDLYGLPGGPDFFLNLFNACLEGGILPDLWRCTELFLLYKGKGDVGDPGSYRGIALMESTLKLYERLLFGRLSRWAGARGLIPDCQFGFRPRSSTLDAVFVFFTMIAKYVWVRGGQLFVCLVDFQKAFPSIERALLLRKLEDVGVSSRFRRCINSIFVGNTFSIRAGNKVTSEYPMTTGLREGSVLSPLLFVLFMSDIQEKVLRPYGRGDFLKNDPVLNRIPIPGLLYADDLVLMCLSADLLRERLRRLCWYADDNSLKVNVSKCEVVVFGSRSARAGTFRYKGQVIPTRSSCKYLGVWLDADMSGKTLADAISHKFCAAVPVFFNLCRRLKVGRLDLVFRLGNSLVFSLLYGCEFLRRRDVVEQCELAWWKGVRAFYGLPNGVSTAALRLLFPKVALVDRVVLAKFSLLHRGAQPLNTLFPEALVCDRGFLFQVHRKGFTQIVKEWCEQLGLVDVLFEGEMRLVRARVLEGRNAREASNWEVFSSMRSTTFAASTFGSPTVVYNVLLEVSRFGRTGVRAILLAISGALSLSYCKSRTCLLCGDTSSYSFQHFLSCEALGSCLVQPLSVFISEEDWRGAATLLLSRFQTFVHATRDGVLTDDEVELFSLLNEVGSDEDDVEAPVLQ